MTANDVAPRRGRPPRIDTSAMAPRCGAGDRYRERHHAAGSAEHLGVSLPGLYHHVKNQVDRSAAAGLAAESALKSTPPPRYAGEHLGHLDAQLTRPAHPYGAGVRAGTGGEAFVTGGVRDEMEMECNGDAVEALRRARPRPR